MLNSYRVLFLIILIILTTISSNSELEFWCKVHKTILRHDNSVHAP